MQSIGKLPAGGEFFWDYKIYICKDTWLARKRFSEKVLTRVNISE